VTKKARDVKKTLLAKGFREESGKHHIYYWFFLDNKKTSVNTYFSHNAADLNDFILSQVSKQLKFEKKDHLIQFLDCHIDQNAYTKMLIDGNHVRREVLTVPVGDDNKI
jgi:hypothetical protein